MFAVLMCTHNGAQYVDAQLRSILEQTLLPTCIIVNDWGSTDDTVAIVRGLADADPTVPISVVEHAEAPGPAASFMSAIRAAVQDATFDYLLFCDQDDVWRSDKIATLAARAASSNEPAVIFSDVRVVDVTGTLLQESFYGRQSPFLAPADVRHGSLLLVNPCVGMTMCVERDFLRSVSAHLSGSWVMHDWAVLLLAVARGRTVLFEPATLVDYRQHTDNRIGAAKRGRVLRRLLGARSHFRRLREQMRRLADTGEAVNSRVFRESLLKAGWTQRVRMARSALASPLLRGRERALLCAAILALW